jgi:hypothetical protein
MTNEKERMGLNFANNYNIEKFNPSATLVPIKIGTILYIQFLYSY